MIPILALSDINYSYHELSGETKALENISFTVNPGEFIAIVGPSGCGKSTLLSLIAGLLVPGSGSLTLNGSPISSVKSKIGYMLQKDHLFEWRSVLSNVLLGLEIHKNVNGATRSKALELLKTYYRTEKTLVAYFKKHLMWYVKSMQNATATKIKILEFTTLKEINELIETL